MQEINLDKTTEVRSSDDDEDQNKNDDNHDHEDKDENEHDDDSSMFSQQNLHEADESRVLTVFSFNSRT